MNQAQKLDTISALVRLQAAGHSTKVDPRDVLLVAELDRKDPATAAMLSIVFGGR